VLSPHGDPYARHDRADFAQEFLRRNPAYRAQWRAWRRGRATSGDEALRAALCARWGLAHPFDPALAVRDAPAFWAPGVAAQLVILRAADDDIPGAAPLPALVPTRARMINGAHDLVLDHDGLRHRFRILSDDLRAPLVIQLAPVASALRAASADAARRLIAGIGTASAGSLMRPSTLQHRRLSLLLGMLDMAVAGATTREIGVSLVYPWLTSMRAEAWKSTSERRRIQRLIGEARGLVEGGYRSLLGD
jgi:hypothetical protein